ncbi:MAG TPA: M14 family zinc carboxypeptidase [Thermoanaerobaculaceae bacterium]|nr:M14 family zinc carboxypeptidase [Thermoanaerobaculaceae bacterium]
MSALTRSLPTIFLAVLPSTLAAQPGAPAFPADHRQLTRTVSYDEMAAFLAGVDGKGPIRVSVEGTTAQGRSVYLVHASRGAAAAFRILFYAQQHGDEPAGKNALLYMIRDIAANPGPLPADVDLWIMPMMNPDGGEAGTRRNSAKADLNRDHIVLEQPETQALHRVARRIRPHLAVDCHEFTRDSDERRERGWIAYPDITMDGVDNPLFDPAVIAASERWVDESEAPETAAGHPFLRYTVGGMPPDEEQRHSAPDIDGGLNAIGMYGGLSFIIESAVMRGAAAPSGDLARRVDAYLVLLWRFVNGDGHRQEDLAAVERARTRPLPPFIPTNYLWVNPGMTVTEFPVVEAATGRVLRVPTANMMTVMAVKTAVPTPLGYAVEPRAAAEFRLLLERQGIPYEELAAARRVRAEACTLLRIEDEFDDVYSRYEGRAIVRREPAAERDLPAGSLWVPLEGEAAVRAALVLEPAAMYGPYQYPRFRALTKPASPLPVVRVVR